MDGDEDHSDNPFWPQHKNSYDLNSKIMLTAIVSLSVVVILVIILHIYARCVLRPQARRRTAIRQLGLSVAQVAHSTEPPKTGLEPSVIAALPIFIFKKSENQEFDNETMECAVCLSILEEAEMARLLPNCKHIFHVDCIDKWLSSHSTCPICRTEAEPRLQPESREPVAGLTPTAPPLGERENCSMFIEGSSDGTAGQSCSGKVMGSSSRLSSFRRMLSRERSLRRIQSCGQEDGVEDLERQ